jgi:hypothetical protein
MQRHRPIDIRAGMNSKPHVAVRLGFILLVGCPQLLDDTFESGLHKPNLQTAPDATAGAGVGGGDAGVSSGGAGGSAGARGAGAALGTGELGTAPVISSVVPADGARGILPDADIVLTFSAPMDTRSVEAAYVSSELSAAKVSFAWSAGDTVLRVRPNAPLRVTSGVDLAKVNAASYVIDIGSAATNKAGLPLVPKHFNFTVVRAITAELAAVQDRDLTGNWRSDGTYGANYCERVDTTICIGDGQGFYQGLVTFPLNDLPSDVVSISAAELSSTVELIVGDPFEALGTLRVEHVEFNVVGPEALSAPALAAAKALSSSAIDAQRMSTDVVAEVRSDWGTRARSQFRLFFDTATNSDAVADQVICDWASAHLTLTYWLP